jgi:hypothetical protein
MSLTPDQDARELQDQTLQILGYLDPRDPPVADKYSPASPDAQASAERAKAAAERERKAYVLEVGRTSPRSGLQAIVDLHPDAVSVIDKYIALEESHGWLTMQEVFLRLLREPRR